MYLLRSTARSAATESWFCISTKVYAAHLISEGVSGGVLRESNGKRAIEAVSIEWITLEVTGSGGKGRVAMKDACVVEEHKIARLQPAVTLGLVRAAARQADDTLRNTF